jgi:hypothetical protein
MVQEHQPLELVGWLGLQRDFFNVFVSPHCVS